MNNNQSESTKLITIGLIGLVIIFGILYYRFNDNRIEDIENDIPPKATSTTESQMMSLNIFIQDKEAALTRDCGITKKVTYQIPKTVGVADTSLKILFEDELSRYGVYDSVSISNMTAKVILKSDMTPSGEGLNTLTSCEIRHLQSVLEDTLTQYPSIEIVEIYSPKGKIEF